MSARKNKGKSAKPAKFNAQNIKGIEDHKEQNGDILYFCKTKMGKKGCTKTLWVNSADPKQINSTTITRSNIFLEYFSKHGYEDRSSFERSFIIECDKAGSRHCVIKTKVMFDDDTAKKANIKLNKNYPMSVFTKKGGIPLEDIVIALKQARIFPIDTVDNIFLIYVIDKEDGRELQDGDIISSKHIEWGKSTTESKKRGRVGKKAQLPYKPGTMKDIMFYTSEYANKNGYGAIDDEADVKNEDEIHITLDKEKAAKVAKEKQAKYSGLQQNHSSPTAAAKFLADVGFDIPTNTNNGSRGGIDLEATAAADQQISDDGSYPASFVSISSGSDSNGSYKPNRAYTASDDEEQPGDKLEAAHQEIKVLQRKYRKSKMKILDLEAKIMRKAKDIKYLRQKVVKLEDDKAQMRVERYYRDDRDYGRDRYRSRDYGRNKYNDRKINMKRRSRDRRSPRYRYEISSTSDDISGYESEYRSRRHRHNGKGSRGGKHRSESPSVDRNAYKDVKMEDKTDAGYSRNTVERLLRTTRYWILAEGEGVPVGHYALHADKSTGEPAACKDSSELWKTKSLLKYCENHSIRIKESAAKMTLKRWGPENLPNKMTCGQAVKITKIGKDAKAPTDWLIVKDVADDTSDQ